MGTCNCTEGKNELGTVMVDTQRNINIREVQQEKSPEESVSEISILSEIFPKNSCGVQGLIRGYLVRREFWSTGIPVSLSRVYGKLAKFPLEGLRNAQYEYFGGKYIGNVDAENIPNGTGQLFANDAVSEGVFRDGKLNGFGRKVTEIEVYTGMWKDGLQEGQGELIGKTNYKGNWKNGLPHGKGTEIWPDGSEYSGDYYKGFRHGKGHFIWANQSKYEGEFRNNSIEGHGLYTWTNGKYYLGDWKNNQMHGKGKFVWEDGRAYQGDYKENLKHGYGILTLANGKRYEGSWVDGKQHGPGTLYSSTSHTKGTWRNGKICS